MKKRRIQVLLLVLLAVMLVFAGILYHRMFVQQPIAAAPDAAVFWTL